MFARMGLLVEVSHRQSEFILESVHLSLNSSLAPCWLKDLEQDSSVSFSIIYKMGMLSFLLPRAEIKSDE